MIKKTVLLFLALLFAVAGSSCAGPSAPGDTSPLTAEDTPLPETAPLPEEKPLPDGPYVLLDRTGAAEGSYTDFNEAVAGLPGEGGTLVVWSDYTTGSEAALNVDAKPLVITARNGATLTVGRAVLFSANVTFTDITLINGAANGLDFLYAQGHNITVTETVNCIQSGEGRYLSLFAGGAANANIKAASEITVCGGIWRNVYLGNYTGSFSGEASLSFRNAEISGGGIYLSNCNGGTSTASVKVDVSGGTVNALKSVANSSVHNGPYAVSLTGGTVKDLGVSDSTRGTVTIDLSDKAGVCVGGTARIGLLTGGEGVLSLFSQARMIVKKAAGNVVFTVSGIPEGNHEYLSVTDGNTDASFQYKPKSGETVKRKETENGFSMILENIKTTTVTLHYGNRDTSSRYQPSAVIIRGLSNKGKQVAPTERGVSDGVSYIKAELECGLYCYKVFYPADRDYGIKYFYVDNSEESLEFTMLIEPYSAGSFMQKAFSNTTDHILSSFYNTEKIKDFKTYATPTFLYHPDDRVFTTNEELVAFCEKIAKENPRAYLFYPIGLTEQYKLKTPVLVFTKDAVPAGASLETVAETVRSKGTREIMLINGGMHGNEPAGMEGVLAYALELSSEYGERILDKFGAVILIPALSADNVCTYIREYPDGCNSNRDLLACEHDGSKAYVKTYGLFQPTVTVTCHEDLGVLTVNETDYSITDIHNMAFLFNGPANTPVADVTGIIDGTLALEDHQGMQMLQRIIDKMNDTGYRAQHYRIPDYYPVCERGYSAALGSYSFLIELNGIDNGKGNFPLRVHGHVAAIKAIAEEIIATNGGVARTVAEAREHVKVKTYDPDNGFILQMSRKVIGTEPFPSIYVDGTYQNKDAVKSWTLYTKAETSRSMPTAYVIPADLPSTAKILALLDLHGIEYRELKAGSTLALRHYTMPTASSGASVGAKKDVTFANGAYLVSTDSSAAYLIAYLFEPDSYPPKEGFRVSLFNMGYIRASDALYRCEESNAADLIRDMIK